MVTCPNCGGEVIEADCKLICTRCRFIIEEPEE